ncbi:hypothetical protein ACWFMI_12450 [Nocardiopsis terrae]
MTTNPRSGGQDRPLNGGMMNTVIRRGDRVLRTAPALRAFLAALTG